MSGTPAWDSFDAYLFDIDGTLLHCTDAVHYFAFCDALTIAAGTSVNLDGITVHGNTDVGILRDAFARHGIAESLWRPRLAELREQMGAQVEKNRSQICAKVLPGVVAMLRYLQQRGALLGTATGRCISPRHRAGSRNCRHGGLHTISWRYTGRCARSAGPRFSCCSRGYRHLLAARAGSRAADFLPALVPRLAGTVNDWVSAVG